MAINLSSDYFIHLVVVIFVMFVFCLADQSNQTSSTGSDQDIKCPHRWRPGPNGGSCYRFWPESSKSWENARKTCLMYGAELLKFDSVMEKIFVIKEVMKYSVDNEWWIGLKRDPNNTDSWLWTDGTRRNESDNFLQWGHDEPNNFRGQEDCAEIWDNLLNDKNCRQLLQFICERPRDIPSMCDVDNGWDNHGRNNCYKFFDEKLTLQEARFKCFDNDADLLVITDEQEQEVLTDFIRHEDKSSTWLKLSFQQVSLTTDAGGKDEFDWSWNLTYPLSTSWWRADPENTMVQNKSQFCSVMVSNTSGYSNWEPENCSSKHKVMCMKSKGTTCRNGYRQHDGRCYIVHFTKPMRWIDAKSYCTLRGTELLQIKSESQRDFVMSLLKLRGDGETKVWVALKGQNSSWAWDTGEALGTYEQIQLVKVNGTGCIFMTLDGDWKIADCAELALPVCSLPVNTPVMQMKPTTACATHFLLTNKGAHAYNGNIMSCQKCGKTFASEKYERQHRCYKCSQCNISFTKKQNYERHSCASTQLSTCEFCRRQYKSENKLHQHKCTYCVSCNRNFSSFQRKNTHECEQELQNAKQKLTMEAAEQKLLYHAKQSSLQNEAFNNQFVSNKESHCLSESDHKLKLPCKTNLSCQEQTTGTKLQQKETKCHKLPTHQEDIKNHILQTHQKETEKHMLPTLQKEPVGHNKPVCHKHPVRLKEPVSHIREKAGPKHYYKNYCASHKDQAHQESAHVKETASQKGENGIKESVYKELSACHSFKSSHQEELAKPVGSASRSIQPFDGSPTKMVFNPVDLNWQLHNSTKLNLQVCLPHSFYSSKRNIGPPKQLFRIRGDGNCFFRSISFLLTGDECHHPRVREAIVSYMYRNAALLSSVTDTGNIITHLHSKQIAIIGTWATQAEIFAAASMLRTNIYVYTRYGNTMKWIVFPGNYLHRHHSVEPRAIYLQHTGLNHYDVVTSTSGDTSTESKSSSCDCQTDTLMMKELQFNVKHSTGIMKRLETQPSSKKIEEGRQEWCLRHKKITNKDDTKFVGPQQTHQINRKRCAGNKKESNIFLGSKNKLEENRKIRDYESHKKKQRELLREKRSNETYRQEENKRKREDEKRKDKEKELKNVKRSNETYRQEENKRKREDEKRKDKEKELLKSKRSNETYRQEENKRKREDEKRKDKEKELKNVKRSNETYRQEENKRKREDEKRKDKEKELLKSKRSNETYRQEENKRKREDEKRKDKEKELLKSKRSNETYRQEENKRKREDEKRKDKEKELKNVKRSNETYRQEENKRKREDEKRKDKEKQLKGVKRSCFEIREKENKRKRDSSDSRYWEKEHKQVKRDSVRNRDQENKRKREDSRNLDREKKRISVKRKDPDFRKVEQDKKQNRKQLTTVDIITNFHLTVEDGPCYICTCCDQLWYRKSVRLAVPSVTDNDKLRDLVLTGVQSVNNKEWICNTCFLSVKNNKLPACGKANGMTFPNVPEELKLTDLEERLVAPRIPFMKLHQLPRGGQISLNGNVVNVPSNVNNTVLNLPRTKDEDGCIAIKLKRKLGYEHHYQYTNVRPTKVVNAVDWLVKNSQLYQEEGIVVNSSWTLPEAYKEDLLENDKEEDTVEDNQVKQPEDMWDETTQDISPVGTMDTLLQPQDITDEAGKVYMFAPAEGNTPVSLFMDKNAEELSFPTLFCGQSRPNKEDRSEKVSYGDICKSELRRSDRRMAAHIPNIFFKYKKLQTKHILDKANLALRKTKGQKTELTASFLKAKENIEKICRLNEGFRIFKDLRGSPPYWEQSKKDLFAMIRKLGIPTWFASFSSAETRWIHLLQILHQTVHGTDITEEKAKELDWFQKSTLIKSDPVTCARHFDHMYQRLLHDILESGSSPVGNVVDYFYKVEFQMRGSPHIHMLMWVEGSPQLNGTEEGEEAVVNFVQTHTTCRRDKSIAELISYQEHSHSRTCRKKNKDICRFNFPLPPMRSTCVLQPHLDSSTDDEIKQHKSNWNKISKTLNELKVGKEMNFDEFIKDLQMTEKEYLDAVRCSISSPKLFLKREVDEIRINSYNKTLLQCWRANLDLQFVLDPYACAMYIVTYISKGQRGMSNLLYNAAKEAREGNKDIRNQVRSIGHKFLTHVEVSAQEAVYYVLQMPLRGSSRDVCFINTAPIEERIVLLKSYEVLKTLPDDSTDVEAKSLLSRYAQRPRVMETLCLADFCAWFRIVYGSKQRNKSAKDDADEETTRENNDTIYICNDGTFLKKRTKFRVIRFVRYPVDSENFFREALMLYYPWREESDIIGKNETYKDRFADVSASSDFVDKMKEYKHDCCELDKALEKVEHIEKTKLEEQWNKLAPSAQQQDLSDEEAETDRPDVYPMFAPQSENVASYSEIAENTVDKQEIMINYMPDADYLHLIQSLNVEQRHFFDHILHTMKSDKDPMHVFLTGGAGVGKSVVVRAIYQALIRFYNTIPGSNPDEPKVLLAAPTGIAAFFIKGNTLHSLFNIPASQGLKYKPLSSEKLNTLQCQFKSAKLLIIDEISMVGNSMFSFVNHRLQQVMGSSKIFGGLSVIAVGDLFQLQPVFDGWIFSNLVEEYGPLATNLWTENFHVFELNQIMRQKDSAEFAQLLNRLRQGGHTNEDIAKLKERTVNTDMTNPEYPLEAPHIYQSRHLVKSHNDLVFELSANVSKIAIKAKDVVLGDVTPIVKEKVKLSIPNDESKTMGLSAEFKSAIGLRVELSVNIDVSDGLANGAAGILKAVGPISRNKKHSHIWVHFHPGSVGKKCRGVNKQLYTIGILNEWTPVFQVKRQFQVGRWKSVLVMRQQFPLRSAAAKTCHRCQGATMDSAVVDFTAKRKPFPHSHYVALSRVTSIDQLYIRNLNEEKISIIKAVKAEMDRLISEMKLSSPIFNHDDLVEQRFKVLFQNVSSLHKHFPDIKPDRKYSSSHICIFAETKLKSSDKEEYHFPGFYQYRFDWPSLGGVRTAYGLMVYSQIAISDSCLCYKSYQTAAGTAIECVGIEIETRLHHCPLVKVAGLYSSPQATKDELVNFVADFIQDFSTYTTPVIFMGDFNVNLLEKPNHQIKNVIPFPQCVTQATTDKGSLLDHVYVSDLGQNIKVGVLESHFSDHKPVFALLQ